MLRGNHLLVTNGLIRQFRQSVYGERAIAAKCPVLGTRAGVL